MTPCKESCCSPPHFDAGLLETQRWLAQTASNSLLLPPAHPQQQQSLEYLDRNGIAVESRPSCRSEDGRVEEEKWTGELEVEQVPVEVNERTVAEDVTMELDEHENNSTEVERTP
ncbi:unnamed protein product [Dibothriocephalus latus]|uniref:Uncharacterized protein n=1 Tax=Dibothriocephalus latus TaxID=60516 RepID=A0A3P7NSF3_DIBLA|nr:unnamed protein product [Dibothriocephalus latus]